MKVGLVIHSGREDSVETAVDAARRLESLGVDVIAARQDSEPVRFPVEVVEPEHFPHGLDFAISFGGDGTFLRAAYLCRDAGIPVLGVNLGRLGFLAEVDRDDLPTALAAVVKGDFVVEERSTLQVRARSRDHDDVVEDWALNEVSIEKSARQRLILLDIHVGEALFAKVAADGLVISTPTGSTAYSFSAGGPILSPEVRATLVTPVAPHSVFGRTLVVGEGEQVHVKVLADQEPAVVSCDGRPPMTVPPGGSVYVVGAATAVKIARICADDFYTLVRTKFGLR